MTVHTHCDICDRTSFVDHLVFRRFSWYRAWVDTEGLPSRLDLCGDCIEEIKSKVLETAKTKEPK